MIIIFYVVCIFLGLIFQKSRICSILISLFMVISVGLRNGGYDYDEYVLNYKLSVLNLGEEYFGWRTINKIFNYLGFDFSAFRFIIALISVFLLYFGISRMTENISLCLSLYLIYPFFLDAVQMRVFFINGLMTSGLSFLFVKTIDPKKNKYNIIIGLILVGLCGLMHILGIFYVIVVLLSAFLKRKELDIYTAVTKCFSYIRKKKNTLVLKKKDMFFLMIILVLLFLLQLFGLSSLVYNFTDSNKLLSYSERKIGAGIIIAVSINLLILLFFSQISYGIPKGKIRNKVKKNGTEISIIDYDYVTSFGKTCIFIMPLFSINMIMNRLWRVYLILLFITFGEWIIKNKLLKRMILTFLLAGIAFIFFIWENGFNVINFMESNEILH